MPNSNSLAKRKKDEEVPIKPLDFELPPEFQQIDKPWGLPTHVFNIMMAGFFTHMGMAYSFFYLFPFGVVPMKVFIFNTIYCYIGALGVTIGCHRYWTHKTFKANKKLQWLLMCMQTIGFQYPIFKWCRDHRVHHKYPDTNADPHNASRGFWFSQMGWLYYPRTKECEEALKTVEISDLANDPIVRFQSKYYWFLNFVFTFFIPMRISEIMCPGMTFWQSMAINMARNGSIIHISSLVNSAAHIWGEKPYDKWIRPTDNKWVAFISVGEGWHNYHHTFPWDYKAAEFGYKVNLSTAFIHFFAWIGWAWDLKTVSHKLLSDRITRTGDITHPLHKHHSHDHGNFEEVVQRTSAGSAESDTNTPAVESERAPWGWGDEKLEDEDVAITKIEFPAKFPDTEKYASKVVRNLTNLVLYSPADVFRGVGGLKAKVAKR